MPSLRSRKRSLKPPAGLDASRVAVKCHPCLPRSCRATLSLASVGASIPARVTDWPARTSLESNRDESTAWAEYRRAFDLCARCPLALRDPGCKRGDARDYHHARDGAISFELITHTPLLAAYGVSCRARAKRSPLTMSRILLCSRYGRGRSGRFAPSAPLRRAAAVGSPARPRFVQGDSAVCL